MSYKKINKYLNFEIYFEQFYFDKKFEKILTNEFLKI